MDVCSIRGAMRLSKEQEQEQRARAKSKSKEQEQRARAKSKSKEQEQRARAKSKSKLSERGECLEKLWKLSTGKLSGRSDKPYFYILNRSMLTIGLAMTVSEDTSR
jgi:uncharacterized FlaG/YvyC family protein